MWIHVYPKWKRKLNSKNWRKRSISYETKQSILLIPMRRMCLCFLIMKIEKIITWIVFIPIDGWTLILKNGGKRSFSYKAEALIHLSRSGERICGTQSLKERKLLCESVFILIERWTLTLKMGQREAFLFKPKHQFIYLNG